MLGSPPQLTLNSFLDQLVIVSLTDPQKVDPIMDEVGHQRDLSIYRDVLCFSL